MTRQEAQKKLGKGFAFVKEDEKAFEFKDLSLPEDADINGTVWVVKESGELLYNIFEYFEKCGIPEDYDEDDEE